MRTFLKAVPLGLVYFMVASTAHSQSWTVKNVKNKAYSTSSSKTSGKLRRGAKLKSRSWIETKAGSGITLVSKGNVVIVAPNSKLQLTSTQKIFVRYGKVSVKTSTSGLKVSTSRLTARSKNARFALSAKGRKAFVKVSRGAVDVKESFFSRTKKIAAGKAFSSGNNSSFASFRSPRSNSYGVTASTSKARTSNAASISPPVSNEPSISPPVSNEPSISNQPSISPSISSEPSFDAPRSEDNPGLAPS